MPRKKITICGAGRVGSTAAVLLAEHQLGDIVIWNRTAGTAKGLALDIQESAPLQHFDIKVKGTGDYKQTKNSDIIIITAGAQRKAGMSRADLVNLNGKIVGAIAKETVKYSPKAIFVIVSNPLDAMVYTTIKVTKLPKKRVIGMAGILDSSRYKTFIAQALKVSVDDVQGMVLGGHGDTMVPLPTHTSINGIPIAEVLPKAKVNQIIKRTQNAGAEIIKLEKSSAFYSPAASITKIVESILLDKKRVLPCSTYLSGEYNQRGICMGVPVKIGSKGIEKIYELKLTKKEKADFKKSAEATKKIIQALNL